MINIDLDALKWQFKQSTQEAVLVDVSIKFGQFLLNNTEESKIMIRTISYVILNFLLLINVGFARAETLGIIVPAYFYPSWQDPNNPWVELVSAANKIPLIAIVNPNSGPGTTINKDYERAIQEMHQIKENNPGAPGGKVIGYIHTSYGKRDIASCKAEIDSYYSFYNVDGIFLDRLLQN